MRYLSVHFFNENHTYSLKLIWIESIKLICFCELTSPAEQGKQPVLETTNFIEYCLILWGLTCLNILNSFQQVEYYGNKDMSEKLYIRYEIQEKHLGRILSKTEWNCWQYTFFVDGSRIKLLFNYNSIALVRPLIPLRERRSVISSWCRYASVYFGGNRWKFVPVCKFIYTDMYSRSFTEVHVLWNITN